MIFTFFRFKPIANPTAILTPIPRLPVEKSIPKSLFNTGCPSKAHHFFQIALIIFYQKNLFQPILHNMQDMCPLLKIK